MEIKEETQTSTSVNMNTNDFLRSLLQYSPPAEQSSDSLISAESESAGVSKLY